MSDKTTEHNRRCAYAGYMPGNGCCRGGKLRAYCRGTRYRHWRREKMQRLFWQLIDRTFERSRRK